MKGCRKSSGILSRLLTSPSRLVPSSNPRTTKAAARSAVAGRCEAQDLSYSCSVRCGNRCHLPSDSPEGSRTWQLGQVHLAGQPLLQQGDRGLRHRRTWRLQSNTAVSGFVLGVEHCQYRPRTCTFHCDLCSMGTASLIPWSVTCIYCWSASCWLADSWSISMSAMA
jgi:hypothetical protein